MGGWRTCDTGSIDPHVYQTFNNSLYAPNANFTAPGPCADFKAWQATGQDAGSKVLPAPSVEDMVAMGRNILAGKPPQKKDRTKL